MGLFLSIPAVGAQLAAINANGIDHVVKPVIAQGGKVQLLADAIDHGLELRAFRIGIYIQVHIFIVPFHILDDPSGDEIHLGTGTGEIQIFTSV